MTSAVPLASALPRYAVTVVLISSTLLPGCLLFSGRHWDEARHEQIEPINAALHRHLPRDIQAKNLDAVVDLYRADTIDAPAWNAFTESADGFSEKRLRWEGAPAALAVRDYYAELFALFATLERTEVRIRRIDWNLEDERGLPAECRLIARGVRPDGSRAVLDQYSNIRIRRTGNVWQITREEVFRRELIVTEQPQFDVATAAAGIDDVHDTTNSPVFRLIGGTQVSSGSAVGDVDCDGLEDVALLNVEKVRLYRNRADGTFEDVTQQFDLDLRLDNAAAGIVLFDADNDGDPDMWISGVYGEKFLVNHECKRFTDATAATGIGATRWSSMPAVADYDRDGDLDVYVVRMGDHEHDAPVPSWEARNGYGDSLYRNDGGGRFTDVAAEAGIHVRGWGLAGAWGDYNNDLYPDMYVGNEFGQNALYRNNRDGTFTQVAAEASALDRGAAMGVTWGDYDNDGDLDLFVSNMYANSRWAMFHPEFPAPVPWYFSWVPHSDVETIIDELTRGSTLLQNNGDGTFTDVSDAAGIRDAQWGWAAEFFDYNNDGHLDIYAANGFVTGPLPDDV